MVSDIHHIDKKATFFDKCSEEMKPHKPIKAIGVVGSDVYDKLIVLRALKKEFPHIIFFTTDLDARLFHPSEIDYTRNLIVGSSFGLRLPRQDQAHIPPFRSVYQTSMFKAVSTIVSLNPSAESPVEKMVTLGDPSRVFEIGNQGPIDVTDDSFERLHAVYYTDGRELGVYEELFGAVGFLIILLLALHGNSVTESKYTIYWGIYLVVCSLIGGYYGHCAVFKDSFPSGEPLSFTHGISIWPTIYLRIIAVFLALYFLLRFFTRGSLIEQRLIALFGIDEDDSVSVKKSIHAFWKKTLSKRWRWPLFGVDEDDSESDKKSIHALWKKTLSKKCRLPLVIIAVVVTAVNLGAGRWAVETFRKPLVPFRGEVAATAETSSLILLLACMLFLIWVVTIMSVLVAFLIGRLYQRDETGDLIPIEWPDAAFSHFRINNTLQNRDWLNVTFVGRLTDGIGQAIVYPFFVAFIAILSRNNYIDAWSFTPALAVVILVSLGIATFSAVWIRRAAERVRKTALQRLQNDLLFANLPEAAREKVEEEKQKRVAAEQAASQNVAETGETDDQTGEAEGMESQPPAQQSSGVENNDKQKETASTEWDSSTLNAGYISEIINNIISNRRGAYSGLLNNPVLLAWLAPFGGIGGIQLIQFMTSLG